MISGTARVTAATTIASARVSVSRASVSNRASVRLPGQRSGALPSSLRFRVAHSVTTRSAPGKPSARSRRQSSAPLRQPPSHSALRRWSQGSSELARGRNGSARPPRRTSRTSLRDRPVRRVISLMATPSLWRQHSARRRPPRNVLKPLRAGQYGEIHRTVVTERSADVAHATLHCQQKRSARVLEEVPAICDLNRFRPPLRGAGAIATAAIAGDDLAAFQITDQRAVAMPLAPRPVVDPDDPRRSPRRRGAASDGPEQRVLADRQQEPPCNRLCRTTA